MKIFKGFTIRLYPTKEQEELMWKHINCARFIWNYMLRMQIERHEAGGKHLFKYDMIRRLTPLKKDDDYKWLYEVSNRTLQIVCKDLHEAYMMFFSKKENYPRFKTKKNDNQSFPTRDEVIYFTDRAVNIEKVGKVRCKTDYDFPHGKGYKYIDPRIKRVRNKWYLSVCMECESQAPILTDNEMGIDLGIKTLATVAYGDTKYVFDNINKSRKIRMLNKRIKQLQHSISRKYEANKTGNVYVKTSNIIKQEDTVKRLYAKISNIRRNHTHQITSFLTKQLLPGRVVMEDLNVSGMMSNRHLSSAVQEQGFFEFIRQMKYKCQRNGIEFVQADRFYPSSKTCSRCGYVKKDLKLKDRVFRCQNCGAEIDRDYNAAVNLQRYEA